MGQDGHDRGAKVIATAFADLGFDVDVGPLFQTPAEAAPWPSRTMSMCWASPPWPAATKRWCPEVIAELKKRGREDILVVRRRGHSAAGLRVSAAGRRGWRLRPRFGHSGLRAGDPHRLTEAACLALRRSAASRRQRCSLQPVCRRRSGRQPRSPRPGNHADREPACPRTPRRPQNCSTQFCPHTGKSRRVGITGVPGVGKSTFIDTLGMHVIRDRGESLAVLSVDPSSPISGGSILGDKTRMERLAVDERAFIRPSPAAATSAAWPAGRARPSCSAKRPAISNIFVETVGVGQSETAVRSMSDFFLLLMLAGAGDELQGIKRGIIEMIDGMAINKADGDNASKAERARVEYASALHLFPPSGDGWTPRVLTCSALEDTGIAEIWQMVLEHEALLKASGKLQQRRTAGRAAVDGRPDLHGPGGDVPRPARGRRTPATPAPGGPRRSGHAAGRQPRAAASLPLAQLTSNRREVALCAGGQRCAGRHRRRQVVAPVEARADVVAVHLGDHFQRNLLRARAGAFADVGAAAEDLRVHLRHHGQRAALLLRLALRKDTRGG